MFTPKNSKLIEQAQGIATKAIDIFTSTIGELEKSNQILMGVIADANKKIDEHVSHIEKAQTHYNSNQALIGKLSEFTSIQ